MESAASRLSWAWTLRWLVGAALARLARAPIPQCASEGLRRTRRDRAEISCSTRSFSFPYARSANSLYAYALPRISALVKALYNASALFSKHALAISAARSCFGRPLGFPLCPGRHFHSAIRVASSFFIFTRTEGVFARDESTKNYRPKPFKNRIFWRRLNASSTHTYSTSWCARTVSAAGKVKLANALARKNFMAECKPSQLIARGELLEHNSRGRLSLRDQVMRRR
jgi:hypothetical protein